MKADLIKFVTADGCCRYESANHIGDNTIIIKRVKFIKPKAVPSDNKTSVQVGGYRDYEYSGCVLENGKFVKVFTEICDSVHVTSPN